MKDQMNNKEKTVTCINLVTGRKQQLVFEDGAVTNIEELAGSADDLPFIAPGLIDLQINGVNGIDFNNPGVSVTDIVNATSYLLSQGITTFLPTVITNSDENICKIVHTINNACLSDSVVNECIWGIHLEGPFLSPAPGAKGAHDEKYIKAPDWELFEKFQEAAGGRIKIITLAPEWEGSVAFIEKCRHHDIIVSIGHSMAGSEQVAMAVSVGAAMSTHLGNGVPLFLQRHPNIIWDQLAAEALYTCIIADGIHVPDSFIKVVIKSKADKTLLVSDATCFAGMAPGEYQNHIGGTVILDTDKRVSLKSSPGLLAGAAKSLLENVETLVHKKISTIEEAWEMASVNVSKMLSENNPSFNNNHDQVIFRLVGEKIKIENVIKNGRMVFG
jgi:N-acetylglucosamine-6-phosphate deacetylase